MKAFLTALFKVTTFILAWLFAYAIYAIVEYLFGKTGEVVLVSLSVIALFMLYYIEEKKNDKNNKS